MESHYDVVIDFCAYELGDIAKILECLKCSIDQYIFVSTADVAKPSRLLRNEQSKLRDKEPASEVELYLWKKCLLEQELQQQAA